MSELTTYRALPVLLGGHPITTLGGAFELDRVVATEVREYDGGELAVGFDCGEANWEWDGRSVTRAELWLYGTRRVTVDATAEFLERDEPVFSLEFAPEFCIRMGSGELRCGLSHAVLRLAE